MKKVAQSVWPRAANLPATPPIDAANAPVAVYPLRDRIGYETENKFACYRTGTFDEPQARRQSHNGGRTKTKGIGTRRGGLAR